MRKTLLSLLLFCLVYLSKAQQTLPAFNYIPQAPTTAAFSRYGDIPVDLSTGVTNIKIPIYTLKENGISIPVSISYHASGIKVQDVASSVGLGWTLNAGGIITRTVLGIKDELLDTVGSNGNPQHEIAPFRNTSQFIQYNYEQEISNPPLGYVAWAQHLFNNMINVAPGNGRYDFHSDRFFYNLGNGESGVFRKDFMGNDFKTIPYKPIEISFIPKNGSTGNEPKIEMTTGDGVRYIFKRNKYDIWHPEKIYNSSNTDSVVFYTHADTITTLSISSYDEFGVYKNSTFQRTEPWVDCSGTCSLSERINNTPILFENGGFRDDEIVLVDSIVGSNCVIRFTYAKDRIDAAIITGGVLSRLTKIQVFNKHTGALIKNFDLSQTYSSGLPYAKRLLLTRIQTGANGEEKYEFKYNPEELPEYYMTAYQGSSDEVYLQDFWGYNRGGTPSQTLLFDDFAPEGAPNLFPNEDKTMACMLQEIKYPTGGKTVFEYESHRVPSYFYGPGFSSSNVPTDGKVGGLRVKKISSYAYEGAVPQVKTYEYVCELSKNYGYLDFEKFTYNQKTFNYFIIHTEGREGLPYWNNTYANICVDNPMGRYIGGPQAPVYYSKVSEYYGDENKNAGKTVYYYHMPDDILGDYTAPDEFRFCGPWDKDLGSYTPPLEKQEEYRNENGQYKLVRKTETEYTKIHDETFATGFNLSSDLKFNPVTSDIQHAFAYYSGGLYEYYFMTLHYSEPFAYRALTLPWKTNVYDYIDGNKYVKTATEYSYNRYGQQTAVSTTTSKGDLLKTRSTYPIDYPAQVPYNSMVERNILSPVVEQSTYKSINGTESLLQSMKINYNYWNYAAQTWGGAVSNQILPQTVVTQKGTNDLETRIQYYSYDDKGNPTYVAKESDTRQLYFWGYNKMYPISQVINVPDNQKPFVAYTSFEDNTTGNWPASGAQNIIEDNTAPTGKRCLVLQLTTLTKALSVTSNYILSYWMKVGSSVSVNANSTVLSTSSSKNGWVYVKRKITGSGTISITGSGYIDELRLYPETAQMTTFAYEPLVGMTAQCDANDRITYHTYDASGRLSFVKDDNGNILKKICYNFQGQPDVCGENAIPQWQLTGVTRCKPCPQSPAYFTNITQLEERDNNVNSETYGTTRWRDTGVIGGGGACYAPGDWQPTGNLRCKQLGGQNTGEQEREMKDLNPCSETGGNTRWDISGTNTNACPLPAVFQSLDVSGNYYKQNCGSQQIPKPYPVTMPPGAFTSSIDIQDATNKAKAEAQRLANLNGECATVYIRMVKTLVSDPADYQQYTDNTFYFYSDAAGTIPMTLPISIPIYFQFHAFWTENGVFAYDETISNSNTYANGGFNNAVYQVESTFCPNDNYCRHEEITILPGPYVIIP